MGIVFLLAKAVLLFEPGLHIQKRTSHNRL